jgi:acetoacetyl-CoA synthetase
MVVDLDDGNGDSQIVMFVVPASGHVLDAGLIDAISAAIRTALSPRFIPDLIIEAPAIPRTLSGKKQELPIKRLFLGWPVNKVIDPHLTQNADVLDWYVEEAAAWPETARRHATP